MERLGLREQRTHSGFFATLTQFATSNNLSSSFSPNCLR
jgi:hypothetical protein